MQWTPNIDSTKTKTEFTLTIKVECNFQLACLHMFNKIVCRAKLC